MKYVKFSLRPVAMLMSLLVVAMVATRDFLFAATEEVKTTAKTNADPKKKDDATIPEMLVSSKKNKQDGYKVDKVQSVKYTQSLKDTPATITVVPEALMEDQNVTTLRDALRNVPGISMQAGEGGTPAGDQLTIRGFSSRTDLYIDNVRDVGGYFRDTFNYEQVEVAKGPSSSYTGRGSTGASINLASKTPKLDAFYKASNGWGTDQYKRTTVDINQPIPQLSDIGLDGVAFRLNGMMHHNDTPGRKVADNERWGFAPSLAIGLDTPTRVTASYFYMYQDNRPDYGIPWVPNTNTALPEHHDYPAPVDFSNYYGLSERDYEEVKVNLVTVKVEHDFNENLTVRDQIRYGRVSRDSLITAPRFLSNNSTAIRRSDEKSRDQVDTILANQLDLISKFETFGKEHDLVTGIELVREVETNHERMPTGPDSQPTDLFSPNPSDRYTENYMRTGNKATTKINSLALYGFDTLHIHEKVDLNGGLRWDYSTVSFGPNTGDYLERADSVLTWNAGIVYRPIDIASLYFGYGTSFNPAGEGLTLSTNATNNAFFQSDPEKARTFELGTKWDLFDRRLAVNAAVFHTLKSNARTEDPNNPNDFVVLEGEQRVRGFELGASGNITEDWALYAAYTVLGSKILETREEAEFHHELGNTPEHSFNIWSTYRLPFNFEVGAGLQYVDKRFNNTNNTRKAPAYILFDAMVAYHVTDHIEVKLNMNNLTDQEYIDQVGGGHFIPGAGRSMILTTSVDFG